MTNSGQTYGFEQYWPSDCGELSIDVRRVLARLVSGPFINADDHGDLWATLADNTQLIQSRLNDLFLELVMDTDTGFAFARNAPQSETFKIPKLMRTHTLNHATSMLLMRVRQLQLQASSRQEVAYTDRNEIASFLEPYVRSEGVQDSATLQRRIDAAINSLKDYSILREHDDRLQISGIVALIVTPEQMSHYLEQYRHFVGAESEPEDEQSTNIDSDLNSLTTGEQSV